MAVLTYARASITGTTSTAVAASAGGDSIGENDRGGILVDNASAAAITVTIKVPGVTRFGQLEPDVTVSIPAAAKRLIGPMVSALVNPDTNTIELTYSAVASVTVAALGL